MTYNKRPLALALGAALLLAVVAVLIFSTPDIDGDTEGSGLGLHELPPQPRDPIVPLVASEPEPEEGQQVSSPSERKLSESTTASPLDTVFRRLYQMREAEAREGRFPLTMQARYLNSEAHPTFNPMKLVLTEAERTQLAQLEAKHRQNMARAGQAQELGRLSVLSKKEAAGDFRMLTRDEYQAMVPEISREKRPGDPHYSVVPMEAGVRLFTFAYEANPEVHALFVAHGETDREARKELRQFFEDVSKRRGKGH